MQVIHKGGDKVSDFNIKLGVILDPDAKVQGQINDLIKQIEGKDDIKINIDTSNSQKKIGDLLNDIKTLKEACEQVKFNFSETGSNSDSQAKKVTESWLSQFKKLSNEYNSLQKQMAKETNPKGLEVLKKQAKEVGKAMDEAYNRISTSNKKIADSFKETSSRKLETSYVKTFDNIASKAENLGQKISKAFNDPNVNMGQLNSLETRYKGLQNLIKNFDMSKLNGSELSNLNGKLSEIETKFKQVKNAAEQTKLEDKFKFDCSKAINELEQLRNAYKSIGKDSSGIDSMISDFERLQSSVKSVDLGHLRNEYRQLTSQMSSMGKVVNTSGGVLRRNFSDFKGSLSAFTLGNLAGDAIASQLYQVKDSIIELDNAFRDVQKVAPDSFKGTAQELESLRQSCNEAANSVATSTTDMLQSVASAFQLGIKEVDKAVEYAKNVNLFANVSDQDVGTADEQLKAILSSYGGINNAMKENRQLVKGAPAGYNLMLDTLNQLNYLGHMGSFLLNCWKAFRAY